MTKANDLALFRRQFLLSSQDQLDLPWERIKISSFYLSFHPELEHTHLTKATKELVLLGYIFDYENPEQNNEDILSTLSECDSVRELSDSLSRYSGHYVLIYKTAERLILLNDACAQQEIYYDLSFSTFASQPKLMERILTPKPSSSKEAQHFYSASPHFLKEKIFVGDTTHYDNIKHLRPNHFLDITNKKISRYFPASSIRSLTVVEAANTAGRMLEGYLKAASMRYNMYMGVTGGYDSRVLFISSLDTKCKYYVTKHDYMDDRHPDIVIPKKLTSMFGKEFRIVSESPIPDPVRWAQEGSIDFPREYRQPDLQYKDHMLINGNLGEIARNCFGNFEMASANELSTLYGYKGCSYFRDQCKAWLKVNSDIILENGYNILDLFYWEERMGNWAAKAKTETSNLGTTMYSPFSSNALLVTLLSTDRKYRDKRNNVLFHTILNRRSSEAAKLPVNPSGKMKLVLFLKKMRLFDTLQRISVKVANSKYNTKT